MNATGADLYAVLGIGRDASPADVKRAFFQLVRVHRPEDDAAGFQAISEAYRVLSDPALRRAYDAEERLPQEVIAALEKASRLCETQADEAVAMAQGVLRSYGRSPTVRFAVASVALKAGRPAVATPILELLVRESPGRADYAEALGDAYMSGRRFEDAERALTTALKLDARRVGAYVSLANVYQALEKPEHALRVLDRGIEACGGADLATLPLRVRKLHSLAEDGQWELMDRVVTSILSCVPSRDSDAAQHAALQLAWLAEQYDRARIYDVAKFALDAALRLAPHPGMKERSARIAGAADAQREARTAKRDPTVARWIVKLIQARIWARMSDREFRELCERLAREMAVEVGRKDREWVTFSGRYPLVAEELQDIRDGLRQAATGELTTRTRRGKFRARRANPALTFAWLGLAGLGAIVAGALLVSDGRTPKVREEPLVPGLSNDAVRRFGLNYSKEERDRLILQGVSKEDYEKAVRKVLKESGKEFSEEQIDRMVREFEAKRDAPRK